MKKLRIFLLLILSILLLSGCNKKEDVPTKEEEDVNNFILTKVDDTKDYVYLSDYRNIKLNDSDSYMLENLVVNIKSDDVDNVNLEISSFVKKSFKDMVFIDGILKQGNIISYDFYENDKFVSVIQKYYPYIDGIAGEEKVNVFVISKEDGKSYNNDDILKAFNYSEKDFFDILEKRIESEDVLYTLMNIKNDGYNLYVNKDGKLIIIYYETSDDDVIRKELIFQN